MRNGKLVELPKAIAFARLCGCLAEAKGDLSLASNFALKYDASPGPNVRASIQKAAVDYGQLGSGTWGSQLGGTARTIADEFVEEESHLSVIGRTPGFTRVPFLTPIIAAGNFGTGLFTGEGKPVPVSRVSLTPLSIPPAKIITLCAVSRELVKFSTPAADSFLANLLTRAAAKGMDDAFLNPAMGAVANERPASITNAGHQVSASGLTATAIESDIVAMIQRLVDAGSDLANAEFVGSAKTALSLCRLRSSNGERIFPDMKVLGGSLYGIPWITSGSVALSGSPTDSFITLFDASKVLLADDGQVQVDISTNASIQMDDAPVTGAAALVSFYQENLVGIKTMRFVAWKLVDPAYSQVLMDVQY